jgi:hypothetical protein
MSYPLASGAETIGECFIALLTQLPTIFGKVLDSLVA